MKNLRCAGFLTVLLGLMLSASAWAAKVGIVDVEDLEMRDGPSPKHQVIEKLKKGAKVSSSNLSIDGYFKVRTSSGKIGFVPGDTLIFQDPSTAPQSADGKSESENKNKKSDKETEAVIRLRALGGMTFFALDDVQTLFSSSGTPFKALKNGFHFGGEVNYILIPSLFVIMRVEQMQKTIYLRDITTRYTFDMTVSGMPATTGVGIRVLKGPGFSLNVGLMAGLSFSTQLKSTALSLPKPNETAYSDTAFAGIARVDAIYHFTKLLGVFAEGGYRYLRSKTMNQPTVSGNGSEIFKLTGSYTPLQVVLSGPFASAGLLVAF